MHKSRVCEMFRRPFARFVFGPANARGTFKCARITLSFQYFGHQFARLRPSASRAFLISHTLDALFINETGRS